MKREILEEIGISKAESIIFITTLRKKNVTVRELSKETGIHRTNIYDVLEKLKEKGLISYFKEGNTTYYNASDPEKLFDFINEKRNFLEKIMPKLIEFSNDKSNDVIVEVYKGKEGMKTAFKKMLKLNKPMYGFGIKGQLREHLPIFAEQWIKEMKRKKSVYRCIYTSRDPPKYYTKIRYLPEKYNGPVATFIYGDEININIWNPVLIAIVIKSKEVADVYKMHFDLLWKIAKD
jgi:sugar-specific transcriptional regulator TrmB